MHWMKNHSFVIPIEQFWERYHIGIRQGLEVAKPEYTRPSFTEFFQSNEYLENKEYDKAIESYDKVINDPNYITVWNNKGLDEAHHNVIIHPFFSPLLIRLESIEIQ
jgi:hypothetical protein